MAFKMRTGTDSEFGNGSNMSEGEIVNVKSGLTTENGGAMFYAPRDGVPERVVTDVDQTIESDINFTGTISKSGTPLTPTAAEINRLSGVTDNIQDQINDAVSDITALQGLLEIRQQSFSQAVAANTSTTVLTYTLPSGAWLVFSYMDLSANVASVYNHVLNNRVVRSSGESGGGSVNFAYASSGGTVTVITFVKTACTVRGSITAIKIG